MARMFAVFTSPRWLGAMAAVVLGTATIVAQQTPAAPAGRGAPPPQPFPRAAQLPPPSAPTAVYSPTEQIRVAPVVAGLQNPWSLAFLPDGDMLVTEKPGRLRIIRKGQLDPTPIAGTPTERWRSVPRDCHKNRRYCSMPPWSSLMSKRVTVGLCRTS